MFISNEYKITLFKSYKFLNITKIIHLKTWLLYVYFIILYIIFFKGL